MYINLPFPPSSGSNSCNAWTLALARRHFLVTAALSAGDHFTAFIFKPPPPYTPNICRNVSLPKQISPPTA